MTKDSFKRKIKQLYKTDDIVNYITAFLFLVAGIFMVIKLSRNNPANNVPERYLIWLLPCIPIVTAFYTCWRIPRDYKVFEIDSTMSVEDKIKLIEAYFLDVKVVRTYFENNYRSYTYRNRFFAEVDVRIYFDDKKLIFNVQRRDPSPIKGYIDFGITSRATKRLLKYLKYSMPLL